MSLLKRTNKGIVVNFDDMFDIMTNETEKGLQMKEENGKLVEVKIEEKRKKITDDIQKAYHNMKRSKRAYERAKDRFYGKL